MPPKRKLDISQEKMPSVEGSFGCLFQPKPTESESIALDYLSGLADPSLLSPMDYVTSTTKKLPRLRYKHMVIAWNKMKSHFSSSDDEKFKLAFSNTKALSIKLISDRIEKDSCPQEPTIVETSEEPSQVSVSDCSSTRLIAAGAPGGPIQLTEALPESPTSSLPRSRSSTSHTPSSRSPSSKSSSSTTSSSTLSPTAINRMRSQFVKNYYEYEGDPWILPSGTRFDNIVYQYVEGLHKESAFHSFVIDRVEDILDRFDKDDQDVIQQQISEYDNMVRESSTLAEWKKEELKKLEIPPRDIEVLLGRGWIKNDDGNWNADSSAQEFIRTLYQAMDHIYTVYKNSSFRLPAAQIEAWFKVKIWRFLINFFDCGGKLDFQPEAASKASTKRKNSVRNIHTKQLLGRKTGGIIRCSTTNLELCAIETGKLDQGATGTKVLTDGRKLGKEMRDTFGGINSKCLNDVKEKLIILIFGLLISGTRMSFLSLHYVKERFLFTHIEDSTCFPPVWGKEGLVSETIVTLLTKLTAFKERLEDMSQDSVALERKPFVKTLTTPLNSPALVKSSYF
ncbi:hypothetical protein BGX21_008386 [Mortierella sp. AD011]|nr:hypothetical protein BGX20_008310 [Mortierella sp. AD010]KAF9397899.1 hypothetical protein BGX21_008386 [Mortierella sp. AD011]